MLTLNCGIPNAGKTTYSAKYAEVIHLDDFHTHHHQCDMEASRVQGDVVVEGICNRQHERKALIEACQHQSPKVCIWLDTQLEECIEREKNYRKRPTHMAERHHKRFEEPTLDEGWDEIVRI